MTTLTPVGILAIGRHLPSEIRANSAWSAETVARWREKAVRAEARANSTKELDEDGQILLRVQSEMHADDPFRGARERRVLAANMEALDIAEAAARDAIARAQVDLHEIDLVLSYDAVPDHLASNSAARLHHRLGLGKHAVSMVVDTACNSFLTQLSLARTMIAAGRARYALLTQTCVASRTMPYEQAYSALFGDGATAVLVGPVSEGRGVLSECHRTDGDLDGGLVITGRERRWWEADQAVFRPTDAASAPRMLLAAGAMARSVAHPALAQAALTPEQVEFYAGHQPTCWFRTATQEMLGLSRARAIDTFAWAGSLSAANLPLVLRVGQDEGLLLPGSIALLFTGGAGVTYSAMVVAWGV